MKALECSVSNAKVDFGDGLFSMLLSVHCFGVFLRCGKPLCFGYSGWLGVGWLAASEFSKQGQVCPLDF